MATRARAGGGAGAAAARRGWEEGDAEEQAPEAFEETDAPAAGYTATAVTRTPTHPLRASLAGSLLGRPPPAPSRDLPWRRGWAPRLPRWPAPPLAGNCGRAARPSEGVHSTPRAPPPTPNTVSNWGRPNSCPNQPPVKQRANNAGVGSGVCLVAQHQTGCHAVWAESWIVSRDDTHGLEEWSRLKTCI